VKQQGFTLIELLVVLVIVGLFAGMLMLTVTPNDNRNVQREAKRLIQVVQLAQDEAIMQGIELGLSVNSDIYSFSILQEDKWLPVSSISYLAEHQLDSPLIMSLEIENEQVVQQIDKDSVLPSILILSSGELTAFKLSLFSQEQPDKQVHIIGQENGQLFSQSTDD